MRLSEGLVIAWIRPIRAVKSLRRWQRGLEPGIRHGEDRGDQILWYVRRDDLLFFSHGHLFFFHKS
jgi:hypothetical protein